MGDVDLSLGLDEGMRLKEVIGCYEHEDETHAWQDNGACMSWVGCVVGSQETEKLMDRSPLIYYNF